MGHTVIPRGVGVVHHALDPGATLIDTADVFDDLPEDDEQRGPTGGMLPLVGCSTRRGPQGRP
ncbi:hypothetical protein ACFWA5_38660 [Streptomyces mirabilis]|uniref:hypothetical protein n=1 Tax=Streptomyces mirabilis TaxID=68239 RepID=UPI00364DEFF7